MSVSLTSGSAPSLEKIALAFWREDQLSGRAGNDELRAGPANDNLNGGENTDFCDGEAGTDTFAACETIAGSP